MRRIKLISSLFLGLILSTPLCMVQAEQLGAFIIDDSNRDNPYEGLLHETGTWAGSKNIPKAYYANSNVREVFKKYAHLRSGQGASIPTEFLRIAAIIENRISAKSYNGNEDRNGFDNQVLAVEIVKASFCFETDPYMMTAKIEQESKYDRSQVSPTGAVGFSQMTGVAIDEVNDQLQNRGAGNAPVANKAYFDRAIQCYMGDAWTTMWGAGVIRRGQRVDNNSNRREAAKKWLVQDFRRDLIYGHILMKINLAHELSSGGTMDNVYSRAFVRYNGDTIKYQYSRDVMGIFQAIDFSPEEEEYLEQFKAPDYYDI